MSHEKEEEKEEEEKTRRSRKNREKSMRNAWWNTSSLRGAVVLFVLQTLGFWQQLC